MSDSPVEAYSTSPLPEHLTIPGWRVGVIVASFAISLPSFLNGAQISLALGFYQAVLLAALAGLILCVGGCFTAVVSVRSRLTTYTLIQRSFGMGGAALVNLVLAVVHFGWFGVNISFFGDALVAATREIYGFDGDFRLYVIAGSVLISVSTIFGFKTLDRLAMVAVPLLGLILVGVCVMAVRQNGFVVEPVSAPPVEMSFGIALSAFVGGSLLAVAAMPDLSRYIHTERQAVQGMVLSFPVASVVMMIAAAIPALAMGVTDIMQLIVGFGLGVPALALLILSTWTINALNLYSASLSLAATFPKFQPWVYTLVGGAVGCGFALMGIIGAFVPFLLVLGLIIPPIAAIYVIDGLTIFRNADSAASLRNLQFIRWRAVVVWIGSVGVAVLATRGAFTLTTVPALDAAFVAAGIYLVVQRLLPREKAVASRDEVLSEVAS